MKLKKIIFVLVSLFFFLLFLHLFSAFVLGQTSTAEPIKATVKISICGNGIAEGGEDCDNLDLGGKTCLDLNYTSGTLSCDIACDFNTSNCSNTPVSSVPAETTASEQTTTSTPTSTTPTTTDTSIVSSPITNIPPTTRSVLIIPQSLKFFDLDKSGKIEAVEIFAAVKSWVNQLRDALVEESDISKRKISEKKEERKCDLNNDGKCNLVDFSILMYYVER